MTEDALDSTFITFPTVSCYMITPILISKDKVWLKLYLDLTAIAIFIIDCLQLIFLFLLSMYRETIVFYR